MRLPREQNTGDYYQIITTGFVRLIVEYNFQFWDWYFENMLFGSIASSIVHLSKEKKKQRKDYEETIYRSCKESDTGNNAQIFNCENYLSKKRKW